MLVVRGECREGRAPGLPLRLHNRLVLSRLFGFILTLELELSCSTIPEGRMGLGRFKQVAGRRVEK